MTAQIINFTPMEKLPNRIRLLRKKAGLTILQLANLLGMKETHLSMIERGVRTLHIDRARQIAHYLNCSVADLLADEDNTDRLPPEMAFVVDAMHQMSPENLEKLREIAQIFTPPPDEPRLTGTDGGPKK